MKVRATNHETFEVYETYTTKEFETKSDLLIYMARYLKRIGFEFDCLEVVD